MTGPTLEIYSDGVKIRICIFLLLKQLQKQDFFNEKKMYIEIPNCSMHTEKVCLLTVRVTLQFIIMLLQFAK